MKGKYNETCICGHEFCPQ